MGDRSWVNVNVASRPVPEQVVHLLDEYGVVGDVADPSADLHIDEAPIGTATVLADKIVTAWPEGAFYLTQEPRYENAGMKISYGPKTGMRAHYIDGEGDRYLYTEDLRGLLEAHSGSPERLVAVLAEIVEEHLGSRADSSGGR